MNLEGITLYTVTEYLNRKISGSKIYKITMPTPLSLVLFLRQGAETFTLLANCNSAAPALWLTDTTPETPAEPPAFCMLLRKHLEEGRITRIKQYGLDRVIELEISLLGRGSRIITKQLIVELTGKNANLIFTEEGKIIDSLKHVSAAMSSVRTIQPGAAYLPPPSQSGLNILQAKPEDIVSSLPDEVNQKLWSVLVKNTTGIGKATAQQLFFPAQIPLSASYLTPTDRTRLVASIKQLQKAVKSENKVFSVLVTRSNHCRTIFPFEAPYVPPDMHKKNFPDINQALCYAAALEPIQLPEHETLQRITENEIHRLQKKTGVLENDLAQAHNAEEQRITADSIMAFLPRIKKGDTQCTLPNIYTGQLFTVALSPGLSPAENAQRYYRKYTKLKRAQDELVLQLKETRESLAYLESIKESLTFSTTRQEVEEIKEELEKSGILPTGKKKKAAAPKSAPLSIRFSDTTTLYVGKNNRQNDELTFKIGSGKDLWFHVQKIPGSHVLLKTLLPEPEKEALQAACQLAAYFSKARGGSQVPVDCVPRRFVKKPSGAKPGFVIFTNQTTFYITPDEAYIKALLQKTP